MKYTFNLRQRILGKILYWYGMMWYIPLKIKKFDMDNKIFSFIVGQFGWTRNPYYEISIEEKSRFATSKKCE